MRVIVIGAGIGGLTAALALRKRGLDVEVFERSAELRDVGAGISLWPNALKALRQLGLAARLDAMSIESVEGALRAASGEVLTRTSAREMDRVGGAPRVFHRAELLTVLVEAAAGIPIHLGHTCTGVVHDADRAAAMFANGASAAADLIVGADGLRSVVRAAVGVPGVPRYAGYTAWRGVARFPYARLLPGETLGCGRRFGMVPVSGERVYWYATSNRPEGVQHRDVEATPKLLRLFAGWHEPIERLIETTDVILSNDIYDRDPSNDGVAGE
jgi:2-polyprenyl-6-methoxyphenol hydroxylase-like FAD-dependent oxidoreductase